ncbi:MAG TPA: hypothetical protein VF798_00140 [Burkholderiaceae bacterium]
MKRLPLVANFVLFIALCMSAVYWALQPFKPQAQPVAPPWRHLPSHASGTPPGSSAVGAAVKLSAALTCFLPKAARSSASAYLKAWIPI